jgi:hypothetical protein
MSKLKLMFTAAALCGGLTATAVSAMQIAPVAANTVASVEQVHWVCGRTGAGGDPTITVVATTATGTTRGATTGVTPIIVVTTGDRSRAERTAPPLFAPA